MATCPSPNDTNWNNYNLESDLDEIVIQFDNEYVSTNTFAYNVPYKIILRFKLGRTYVYMFLYTYKVEKIY